MTILQNGDCLALDFRPADRAVGPHRDLQDLGPQDLLQYISTEQVTARERSKWLDVVRF